MNKALRRAQGDLWANEEWQTSGESEQQMNFTTEQLEKATDIILESGPTRSLSRERRLLEIEPNIQAEVMNAMVGLIGRIQEAARSFGEAVVYEHIGSAAAEQTLAEQFPMFRRSTIRRIVNQVSLTVRRSRTFTSLL